MPANAQTGILTFLFTDLEGSTPLWEKYPEIMQEASARHDALLREAFETNGGRVVKTTGDGFHVVFDTPADGLRAAIAGQQAIGKQDWPSQVGRLRVRMGIHSGESQARDEDYYGPELNRAARIMGIGHGGQILLSRVTADLLRSRLPDSASLKDMGRHRLKGLADPERIFQVDHPSMESDFPPLQSSVSNPHNLPSLLTNFVGRQRELLDIRRMLPGNRLLTLTGPGGNGKTRLMLQAAGLMLEDFAHGVWLFELAPLNDPELVPEKIASVLGVRGHPDRSLVDSLVLFLRRRETLLLLDNAEHVIEKTAQVAEHLLAACPKLVMLVTSREPLAIPGETILQVPSLSLPPRAELTTEDLTESEAVQLFLDRARTVRPDFELRRDNRGPVAEIVRRLDGIPLALELAAARLRVMSAGQIAERLQDRFRLLVSGSRTALPRQQTLQALIDWSWNLLDEREKILLARLSVFSGGWILEDAQKIAGLPPLDSYFVLDGLDSLVRKSLVVVESNGESSDRFQLLESILQYASNRLEEMESLAVVEERHAAHFVDLVRQAERTDATGNQKETIAWIKRLVRETDNFRSAFDWLAKHNPFTFVEVSGKLLVLGAQSFWSFSTQQSQRWLSRAIEIGQPLVVPSENRIEHEENLGRALSAMASVGFTIGRHGEGVKAGEDAISILRPHGETKLLSYALATYAFNQGYLGRLDEAVQAGLEARRIARRLGEGVPLSLALGALGLASMMQGDLQQTQEIVREGKEAVERLGNTFGGLQFLMVEGHMYARMGKLAQAEQVYRRADEQFREIDEPTQSIITRSELAHALRGQRKWQEARSYYRETIQYFLDMGHEPAVANQLECFAYIAIGLEEPEQAARLLGASQSIRERTENPIALPWEKQEYESALTALKDMIGQKTRDEEIATGRGLKIEDAVGYAIEQGDS